MRICKIVVFALPANHRIKLKECEKKDKYLDLARELKKIWNECSKLAQKEYKTRNNWVGKVIH